MELLTPGNRKRDEEKCSSNLTLGHGAIEDFHYCLIFHLPVKFDTPPSLKVYDFGDNQYEFGGSFDLEKRATKYIYSSTKMNTEQLTAGKISAEWVPS
jgi:hypothetical protein